jgi:site-specific DNA recombinase
MMKSDIIKKRCAIYTRKSTDEGLDQDFNSLDAQREAAEHHIRAQAHEGWTVLPDRYDDGGYSGGSMERPAVERLIQDIENGLIDVVVVYKIDRLSRSMADFMKIMELFDKHNVSFVSVTQHFNTDTSMGRLILNILQSFAQFEREMTAERIRDKFAASKRKGMWMGGVPPLGYDVKNRKLEINPDEAEIIQFIFKQFLETGSATQMVGELEDKGYQSKSWVSNSGKHHQGKPLNKSAIYKILSNPIYIGKISHKGKVFEGEHIGIVDPEDFETVKKIKENRKPNSSHLRTASPYLLRGLVFDADGYAFTCGAAKKKHKRYKYYISTQAVKKSYSDCPIKTISAPILEAVIIEQMRRILSRPEWSKRVIDKVGSILNDKKPDDTKIMKALQNFDVIWDELFPIEQQRLAKLLIKRVTIHPKKVIISMRPFGIAGLVHEMLPDADIKIDNPTEDTPLDITIPVNFKMRGGRKYITTPEGTDLSSTRQVKFENNIMKAVVSGHRYQDMLDRDQNLTIKTLAQQEKLDHGYIAKSIRMTQLAPDIIEAILNGKQPHSLSLTDFMKPFPNGWDAQRKHFGFYQDDNIAA